MLGYTDSGLHRAAPESVYTANNAGWRKEQGFLLAKSIPAMTVNIGEVCLLVQLTRMIHHNPTDDTLGGQMMNFVNECDMTDWCGQHSATPVT